MVGAYSVIRKSSSTFVSISTGYTDAKIHRDVGFVPQIKCSGHCSPDLVQRHLDTQLNNQPVACHKIVLMFPSNIRNY